MSLSPTGSPQHQPPQSPNTSISSISSSSGSANPNNSNYSHSNNGPPSKRIKSANNFNYDSTSSVSVSADYKPIINENNQQQGQQLTSVILTNGSKTVPTTTTIAKTLKQVDNRTTHNQANIQQPQQQQQQPPPQQQQHQQQQQQQQQQQHQQQQQQNGVEMNNSSKTNENHLAHTNSQPTTSNTELTEEELNRMFLSGSTPQLPNFGSINIEFIQLPSNCNLDDVKKFEEIYKDHCEKILDMVIALKFMSLCEVKEVIDFVKQCDYQFYQFCIEILIPDVLGTLPPTLVQSIRQLAKHLDGWLRNALSNVPEKMKQSKMLIINTFSMTLRRYTSLNHLAQTVRNSLQNENILSQMLHDISKVDFSYIKVRIIFKINEFYFFIF